MQSLPPQPTSSPSPSPSHLLQPSVPAELPEIIQQLPAPQETLQPSVQGNSTPRSPSPPFELAQAEQNVNNSANNMDSTMISLPDGGNLPLPLNQTIRPLQHKRRRNSTENAYDTPVNLVYSKKHKTNITTDIPVFLLFYYINPP